VLQTGASVLCASMKLNFRGQLLKLEIDLDLNLMVVVSVVMVVKSRDSFIPFCVSEVKL